MTSSSGWISVPEDSDFSLKNLPLGVFSPQELTRPRCATRIGDTVIDLSVLEEAGLFDDIPGLSANVFCQETLNAFVEHPKPVWIAFRQRLLDLFQQTGDGSSSSYNSTALSSNAALRAAAFYDASKVTFHLPIQIGDYTDFYSSREHATNVGIMFRGKDNALQPNWLHLPVGYHGRSSTVFLSGTPIRRPMGQLQKDNDDPTQGSIHAACRLLDFELEMAAVVGGPPNPAGECMTIQQAKDRIFGYMLMNDWSARDIQKWEYVPLGPFTAKNFATTVSPWIVMTAALDDFIAPTSAGQQTDPVPLPYLQDPEYASYDISLTVAIQSKDQSEPTTVCQSNFKNMYWNSAQQLVHHSVSGCIMKAGDLLGSGTISGAESSSFGSMLELSWKGSKEVSVGNETRKFLKDGDTVIIKGWSSKPGLGKIGFGDCSGTILPAHDAPAPCISLQTVDRYKNFKLYSYWRSSCSWRVRVALAAKSIDYLTIPIDITKGEQRTKEFLAKNPLGKVPVLEVTDSATGEQVFISQSVAIYEFLDKVFPTRRSMIPIDPADRAAAFEMVEVINAGIQPLQNPIYLQKLQNESGGLIKVEDQAKKVNESGLQALETLVKRRRGKASGPFALGTFSPSIVDACLVPQMYNARRFGVDVNNVCPMLVEIEGRCIEHPWFQASHPSQQVDAPLS